MALATPAQITKLQILRQQHCLDEDTYRNMLHQASDGRTTSTKGLTQLEAFKLIDGLVVRTPQDQKADKMRKKILGMAREMGWLTPDGKVDLARVNGWCQQYGYDHKPMNRYQYQELPKLVSQFEQGPYKSYLSKI